MSNKVYRFAIIGAGVIGKAHAKQLRRMANAELVAVCDKIPERAKALGEEYHCDWYVDLNDLLKRPDVDIINVCTPSGCHGEHTIAAATAGKHVITEKPMEISLEKADEMIRVCKQRGVKLSVVSQRRFAPTNKRLSEAISAGKIGKLLMGSAFINWYRTQEYYDSGDWRGTWELDGGGVLMNQGIHTIDLLQHFMGPIDSVYARCALLGHSRINVEDSAVATLQFRSGAIGVLVGTTCAYPGLATRIELFGTDGSVIVEDDCVNFVAFKHETEDLLASMGTENDSRGEVGQNPARIPPAGHIPQFEDMIQAIDEDREPYINGPEARKPLEIILSVYESSRTGCPVKIGG